MQPMNPNQFARPSNQPLPMNMAGYPMMIHQPMQQPMQPMQQPMQQMSPTMQQPMQPTMQQSMQPGIQQQLPLQQSTMQQPMQQTMQQSMQQPMQSMQQPMQQPLQQPMQQPLQQPMQPMQQPMQTMQQPMQQTMQQPMQQMQQPMQQNMQPGIQPQGTMSLMSQYPRQQQQPRPNQQQPQPSAQSQPIGLQNQPSIGNTTPRNYPGSASIGSQPQQMLPSTPTGTPMQQKRASGGNGTPTSAGTPGQSTSSSMGRQQIAGSPYPQANVRQTPQLHVSTNAPVERHVVSREKLQELVQQLDPSERLDPEAEDLLLMVADEFVESVTEFACKLAKHRKSPTLEAVDVELHLEKAWNIKIPGFTPPHTDGLPKRKMSGGGNANASTGGAANAAGAAQNPHQQRLSVVKRSKK